MYKDVLQSIAGVEIFPIISLILFMIVFAGVAWHVWRMTGEEALEMSRIPLEDSSVAVTSDYDPSIEGRQ